MMSLFTDSIHKCNCNCFGSHFQELGRCCEVSVPGDEDACGRGHLHVELGSDHLMLEKKWRFGYGDGGVTCTGGDGDDAGGGLGFVGSETDPGNC